MMYQVFNHNDTFLGEFATKAEAEAEAKLDIGINNRSAAENRKVIETLINELSSAKKYRKAKKAGNLLSSQSWVQVIGKTMHH